MTFRTSDLSVCRVSVILQAVTIYPEICTLEDVQKNMRFHVWVH